MKVQILVDNRNSWIIPFAKEITQEITDRYNTKANLIHEHQDVEEGDVLFLLSCEKIFKKLHLNKHNLVIHESDLPQGKGWSPVTWQVLEGLHKIPITLFEAQESVDSGMIYYQDEIALDGGELLPEIKDKQGQKTKELILKFLDDYPEIHGREQSGEESFYPRRRPEDSALDVDKTIKEQFNLLRVCDNERYPAFFTMNGKKYVIKIYKADE